MISMVFFANAKNNEERFSGYHWGGPGFDQNGKHTLFSAHYFKKDDSAISIWIDHESAQEATHAVLK